MRVLAGDIGGTKTAIAMIEMRPKACTIVRAKRYHSPSYPGLEEIVQEFLSSERSRPAAAGFGVAGPVRDGAAKVTKLPWHLEERRIARRIGIPRVTLVNDFVAAAVGLDFLKPRQLATLYRGRPARGEPIGILGAGTGLGQAAVVHSGRMVQVIPSEGGHADFGPRTPLEDRLVAFVRQRFGRASRDRILSGGGLAILYEFLKADGFAPENPAVARALRKEDRAAVISRMGMARRDRLCRKALELFAAIYGSEAGNLALQYRATGGVFIAGGIAPRILPELRRPGFLHAFRRKPPMEELLGRIPVRVVLDERLGLFGAAASAYRTWISMSRPSRKTRPRFALR